VLAVLIVVVLSRGVSIDFGRIVFVLEEEMRLHVVGNSQDYSLIVAAGWNSENMILVFAAIA